MGVRLQSGRNVVAVKKTTFTSTSSKNRSGRALPGAASRDLGKCRANDSQLCSRPERLAASSLWVAEANADGGVPHGPELRRDGRDRHAEGRPPQGGGDLRRVREGDVQVEEAGAGRTGLP